MDKQRSTELYFGNPYAPVITQVLLPFSGPIPGGLTPGKQIQIQGVVENKPGATGFSINLCEGPQIEPSCLFHLNPRFNEGCIVRNAMLRRGWGPEERQGGLPIMKGQLFEVIIMADNIGYFVAVNGRHFTEFKHRAPMASARFLHIKGDFLKINFIQYEGKDIKTAPAMPVSGQQAGPGFHPAVAPPPYTAEAVPVPGVGDLAENAGGPPAAVVDSPVPVPVTLDIPGQLVPGRMIHISAVPLHNAKRFTISLRNGQRGNVNFHFDVRLSVGGDHKVVVRNTLVSDKWGHEERQADRFPFSPNTPFNLVIMAEASAFKVAVNNVHFTSYAHRQPLAKSDTLNITGDIHITNLRFQ